MRHGFCLALFLGSTLGTACDDQDFTPMSDIPRITYPHPYTYIPIHQTSPIEWEHSGEATTKYQIVINGDENDVLEVASDARSATLPTRGHVDDTIRTVQVVAVNGLMRQPSNIQPVNVGDLMEPPKLTWNDGTWKDGNSVVGNEGSALRYFPPINGLLFLSRAEDAETEEMALSKISINNDVFTVEPIAMNRVLYGDGHIEQAWDYDPITKCMLLYGEFSFEYSSSIGIVGVPNVVKLCYSSHANVVEVSLLETDYRQHGEVIDLAARVFGNHLVVFGFNNERPPDHNSPVRLETPFIIGEMDTSRTTVAWQDLDKSKGSWKGYHASVIEKISNLNAVLHFGGRTGPDFGLQPTADSIFLFYLNTRVSEVEFRELGNNFAGYPMPALQECGSAAITDDLLLVTGCQRGGHIGSRPISPLEEEVVYDNVVLYSASLHYWWVLDILESRDESHVFWGPAAGYQPGADVFPAIVTSRALYLSGIRQLHAWTGR